MPASLHCPRQHCHPWPIPPRLRAERSLRAMHPSKWRQYDQSFLLPVAFAERDHLCGVAVPGARSVEPSRVGRVDPEQVNVGARALRRQLPKKEFVPSVPDRHTLRLVNAMDEPHGKQRMKPRTLIHADVAVNARPVPQSVARQNTSRVVIRASTCGVRAASVRACAPRCPNASETLYRNQHQFSSPPLPLSAVVAALAIAAFPCFNRRFSASSRWIRSTSAAFALSDPAAVRVLSRCSAPVTRSVRLLSSAAFCSSCSLRRATCNSFASLSLLSRWISRL